MSVPTDELSMTRRSAPPSEKFSNAETIRTNTYINYTGSNDGILCLRLKSSSKTRLIDSIAQNDTLCSSSREMRILVCV